MAEPICPHCLAWRYGPEDRYCGNCGESLLVAHVEGLPVLVYADQSPERIELILSNTGSGSLEGTQFEVRAARDGAVALQALIPDGELRANDGSRYRLALPLKSLGLGGPPVHWEVRHRAAPGLGDGRLLGEIVVNLEPPRLELIEAQRAVPVADLDHPSAQTTTLTLRLTSASDGAMLCAVACESPYASTPPPQVKGLGRPTALSAAAPLPIQLALSPELILLLINHPAGVNFDLVLSFCGRESAERDRPVRLPFTLRVPSPARPEFRLLERRFVGMAGSGLRLRAEVHNRGGEPCRLVESRLQITQGTQTLAAPTLQTPGRQQPLGPGERRSLDLTVPLDFAEIPPGGSSQVFALDWEQAFDTGPVVHSSAQIEVHGPRDFHGIVAIDFGTTASAAAVQPTWAEHPTLITLGEMSDHLPTAILYELDDAGGCQVAIGDDAVRRLGELGADYRYYFDNIKLHLHSRERQLLPDGRQRTWAGIAADYLAALRTRLEAHPAIAARVCEVYPTHPATFPPLATDALLAAYRAGGMEPRRYRLRDGGRVVMSESWPQVLVRLPLEQVSDLAQRAFGDFAPPPEENPRFGVMSFDVGGGTTDMSVFQIERRSNADITISELGTDSDFGLCGTGISRLIAAGLVGACDACLAAKGLEATVRSAPYVLPWDERPPGTTALALDNGRAIAALALRLQDQRGPFWGLRERIEPVAKQEYWTTVGPGTEPNDPVWVAVRDAWAALGEGVADRWPLPEPAPTLRLRLGRGGELEIPWGRTGVWLDLGAFYTQWVTTAIRPLERRVAALLQGAAAAKLEPLYIVVTGRGSLFPPVVDVIVELTKRHFGLQHARFLQVDSPFLKGIVAHGTTVLAALVRYATGVQFLPLALAKLCVAAGLDPNTGRRRLIPIADGVPRPEDGLCICTEPLGLAPGDEPHTLELYVSPIFDGVLQYGRDMPLAHFTARVELDAAAAAAARIAVERLPPDCLRVLLIWPGAAAGTEPGEGWQRREVGRYTDSEGGCNGVVADSPVPPGLPETPPSADSWTPAP